MKSIDFKSLLIGILETALVMALMGTVSSSRGKYIPWCPNGSIHGDDCYLTNAESGVTKGFDWSYKKPKIITKGFVYDFVYMGSKPDY